MKAANLVVLVVGDWGVVSESKTPRQDWRPPSADLGRLTLSIANCGWFPGE